MRASPKTDEPSCHLQKLVLPPYESLMRVIPEAAGYRLRVCYEQSQYNHLCYIYLTFPFLFLTGGCVSCGVGGEQVGKLERKLYTECSGCCEIFVLNFVQS